MKKLSTLLTSMSDEESVRWAGGESDEEWIIIDDLVFFVNGDQ